MKNEQNIISKPSEYNRYLPGVSGGFRGVDLTSNPASVVPYRFSWLENMWKDYDSEQGGAIETVPGYRRVQISYADGKRIPTGSINGLFSVKVGSEPYLLIHEGKNLRLMKHKERDAGTVSLSFEDVLEDAPSRAFVFREDVYFLDGKHYKRFRTSDLTLSDVKDSAYVPTTFAYRKQYEQRNMLTDDVCQLEHAFEGADATGQSSGVLFTTTGTEPYVTQFFTKDTFVSSEESNKTEGSTNVGTGVRFYHLRGGHCRFGDAYKNLRGVILNGHERDVNVHDLTAPNLKDVYFTEPFTNQFTVDEGAFPKTRAITVHLGCTPYELAEKISVGASADFVKHLPPNLVIADAEEVTGTMWKKKVTDIILPSDFMISHVTSSTNIENNNGIRYTVSTGRFEDDLPAAEDNNSFFFCATEDPEGALKLCIFYTGEPKDGYVALYSAALKTSFAFLNISFDPQNLASEYRYGENVYPVSFLPMTECEAVYSATDGGNDAAFGVTYESDGKTVASVVVAVRDGMSSDADVQFRLRARSSAFGKVGTHPSFSDENSSYLGTSIAAIEECRIAAEYDGRIFLSGNPNLPNTVFYSARNDLGVNDPAFFGCLNFFNDGSGPDGITSLLSTPGMLAVLKRDTVYYHIGADGDDVMPRIYPSTKGNAGIGGIGASCNFLDDPCFLSGKGLEAVGKENLTLERTVVHRSSNVDGMLTREDLSKAEMVEWKGYLCVFIDGRVYLADSRAVFTNAYGTSEYEWFLLSDVGTYENETAQYRSATGAVYADDDKTVRLDGNGDVILTKEDGEVILSFGEEEFKVGADEVFRGLYTKDGQGYDVEYASIGGKNYPVERTGEVLGSGDFYPGVHPHVLDECLYFGTKSGDLLLFNTDKYGEPVGNEPVEPGKLHRSMYHFAGRAICAKAVTSMDDCGIPHLMKTTVRRSLVLRSKLMDGSSFLVSVATDKNPVMTLVSRVTNANYSNFELSFGDLLFSASHDALCAVKEKEKRWVEKQYMISSDGFCAPFGIYSMSYRFTIAGRIK